MKSELDAAVMAIVADPRHVFEEVAPGADASQCICTRCHRFKVDLCVDEVKNTFLPCRGFVG